VSNPLTTSDGPSVQPMDHAYMQRSLLQFNDPSGYILQISDLVDPREHLKERLEKKRAWAAASGPGLLQGFDHVQIICTNVSAERDFFGLKLGLEELSHRTETVPAVEGFEESVFAAGMTDLELTQSESTRGWSLGPGAISALGFWTDDVAQAYGELTQRGVAVGDPPSVCAPLPGMSRRAFVFAGLDGLRLEIAQRI
jgi:catechol 2,3-dioxygenase-like lactoylglutathione lyase family enzyme